MAKKLKKLKKLKQLCFTNREDWRAWLEKNHGSQDEVWLVYYKKHTAKPTIPYDDAVEEALCFGWIDSIVRRIDDQRYMQKYTPRRKGSMWSVPNKRRALKMIRQGRMTPAGKAKIDEAKNNGKWQSAVSLRDAPSIPADLKRALAAHKKARQGFDRLSASLQNRYIWWINSAKKEATRHRRIQQTVELAAAGKQPGTK